MPRDLQIIRTCSETISTSPIFFLQCTPFFREICTDFFFIICGNMCCRLCIEADTNRLAGVFKLAKRSLRVKSQVKQYIYPPAFCKMMMNNLKRCNINLIIIIYLLIFDWNIFWRSILIFKCLCSIRQFFSFL